MPHRKKSLNVTIGTVIMCISWLLLVAWCITYLILLLSSKNPAYLLTGIIGACGMLFQIYFLRRIKEHK
jgi:peptidoglycan biosynthesis protein MviN/MurJ (putative lipid II flippase)